MLVIVTSGLPILPPLVVVDIPLAPSVVASAPSLIVIIVIDGLNVDGARDINLTIIVLVTIIMVATTKRDGYPWFRYKFIQRQGTPGNK